jgi:hypothetical protein
MFSEPGLLSSVSCGPVFYFSRIVVHEKVYLEQHEHFIKQTYRNRYTILSANGPLDLIIPVEHGRSPGLKIRDTRIAYHSEWQRNHWRAICSAYNNSPFFQYYQDEISSFYIKKQEFLFDFNLDYLQIMLSILGIRKEIVLTEHFEDIPGSFVNYREIISPKTECSQWLSGYIHIPYTQVFSGKFPFIPGLSILDLLFNEGPLAAEKL